MAITVRAVGTIAAGIGAISPGMPAGVLLNDILLLFIESAISNGAVTGGTETWTEVADSPQSVGSGTTLARVSVYWARASQDTPTSPSVAAASNHQQGVIVAFEGVTRGGNPWNVTMGGSELGPDTSITLTGDTTTIAECMVALACATSLPDADTTTEFSGLTNVDLTSLTEWVDNTTSQGNGGGLFVGTGIKSTAGAFGGTTVTAVTAAAHAFISIALIQAIMGTGALISGVTDITGAGISASSGTGALVSGAADVIGAGMSASSGTGTLASQAADITGTGVSASTGTGALLSGAADVTGAGQSTSTGTGALTSQAADVTGTGLSRSTGTGALLSGGADATGVGGSGSTGDDGFLVSDDVDITGAGISASTGTGTLVSGTSDIDGTGISFSTGTGTLVSGTTDIDGAGLSASSGTGTLLTEADITGAGISASSGIGVLLSGTTDITGAGAIRIFPEPTRLFFRSERSETDIYVRTLFD